MDIQLSSNFDSAKISKYLQISHNWVYSVKHDGICVYTTPDGPRTRSGKQINNVYLREFLAKLPSGLQGEICAKDYLDNNSFKLATSLVMTKHINEGQHAELMQKCCFKVFNAFSFHDLTFNLKGYAQRMFTAQNALGIDEPTGFASIVDLKPINLYEAEEIAKDCGEGIIVTHVDHPYYNGRSKESLKIKNLQYMSGVIVGVECEKYGSNLKTVPEALWGTEKPQVSKLILENDRIGRFNAGGGLTLEQKRDIYKNVDTYIGLTCVVKYLEIGTSGKPRQPVIMEIKK